MLIQNAGAVKIVEVGPRDGLQNEKSLVSTEDKLKYIELLAESGLKVIEPTSFVSPKSIPQMADSRQLYQQLGDQLKKQIGLPCLVPNIQGMQTAIEVGVEEIAIFTATSDEFSRKNVNASVEESFERLQEVAKLAQQHKIRMRGYVSTAFGCPYSGEIGVEKLVEVTERLLDLGVYEVSIGDTIGVATPGQVEKYLNRLLRNFAPDELAMHFHDTRAMALVNILVSYHYGIRTFDASSGGLGGCPYAKGASGNVATEELVRLFDSYGIHTDVSLEKLMAASAFILEKLGKESPSKLVSAYLKTGKI